LVQIRVAAQDDGSMDLDDFKLRMQKLQTDSELVRVIVLLTYGTTCTAALDDIPQVREILEEIKRESLTHFDFALHMDGALYAPVLPVLKTFGDRKILDLVHSLSFSMHKFFGMPLSAGVVLTSEEYDHQVFGQDCDMVEYVAMQDRLTVTGTRSGLKVLLAHKLLETYKID
jgi:histidine decarboxylase